MPGPCAGHPRHSDFSARKTWMARASGSDAVLWTAMPGHDGEGHIQKQRPLAWTRTGAEIFWFVFRSIVAAQRAAVVVVADARTPGAIGAVTVVIGTLTIDPAFLVGRRRGPVAGTGIGRPLVDVVILLHRIGQPLGGPAAAGVAAAVAIARNRRDIGLCAGADIAGGARRTRAVTARHRGRRGHHGDRRYHSGNQMTHYSLLWVSSCWLGFWLVGWITCVASDTGGDSSRRRFAARRSPAADWPGSRAG